MKKTVGGNTDPKALDLFIISMQAYCKGIIQQFPPLMFAIVKVRLRPLLRAPLATSLLGGAR